MDLSGATGMVRTHHVIILVVLAAAAIYYFSRPKKGTYRLRHNVTSNTINSIADQPAFGHNNRAPVSRSSKQNNYLLSDKALQGVMMRG